MFDWQCCCRLFSPCTSEPVHFLLCYSGTGFWSSFPQNSFFADVVRPVYLHSVLKAFAGGHLFVLCDESCGSVLRWAVRYTDKHSSAVHSMTGFHSAPPLLIFLFILPFLSSHVGRPRLLWSSANSGGHFSRVPSGQKYE